MEPIFTLPYSEYEVANVLNEKLKGKGFSIFVPTSRQEKGIDLILYHSPNQKIKTIQVKSSRTYINHTESKTKNIPSKSKYCLWFKRFEPQKNSNLFLLVGIYPNIPNNVDSVNAYSVKWTPIILVFEYEEMKKLLENIKLKRSDKADKMFAFGFDSGNKIFLTRGSVEPLDKSDHLLDNRIERIVSMFNE